MTQPVILVVEDNDIQRKVIKLLSNEYGFDAVLAANAVAGCDAFKQRFGEIDLVLMDLRLPDISGEEAALMIRRMERDAGRNYHIPIIAMTGFVSMDDRERCLSMGFEDCLIKPFSSMEFRSMVLKWTSDPNQYVAQ